jgi:hypothetical protein
MIRTLSLVLVVAAVLITPQAAWAVIIGYYPGLDALIEQADAVVILRIDGQKGDFGSPTLLSTHDCYIYQSLKGEIPIGQRITLRLMDTRSEFVTPYAVGSTHLMFLKKEGTQYRTLAIQGANVQLSPLGHEKMPEGATVKERVAALIEGATAYRQQEHEKELAFLKGLMNEQGRPVDLTERRKDN